MPLLPIHMAARAMAVVLAGACLTPLSPGLVFAEGDHGPSSVGKGVLLVARPGLNDPNFRETVVLIVEHGAEGTLGLVLNRSTPVLLSEALPDLAALKGTTHTVFAGGPVELTRLLLLFRIKDPPAEARPVFDGVYVGGTPTLLEQILTKADPHDTFRAFAGSAGWGPGQLNFEMLQGAWATLPPDSFDIFGHDPATLWQDCLTRLQAPMVISY